MTWQTTFHHYDAQESTVAITNASSLAGDAYVYDGYGVVRHGDTAKSPFLFCGKRGYYYDQVPESQYIRARNYSARLARFSSGNVTHRYSYANGNPISANVPSGLRAERGRAYALGTRSPDSLNFAAVVVADKAPRVKLKPQKVKWQLLFGCGQFEWNTDFEITGGSKYGYIVQEVCVSFEVRNCRGSLLARSLPCEIKNDKVQPLQTDKELGKGEKPRRFCYYEVWQVDAGAIKYGHGGSGKELESTKGQPADQFGSGKLGGENTCGSFSEDGNIFYYPSDSADGGKVDMSKVEPPGGWKAWRAPSADSPAGTKLAWSCDAPDKRINDVQFVVFERDPT